MAELQVTRRVQGTRPRTPKSNVMTRPRTQVWEVRGVGAENQWRRSKTLPPTLLPQLGIQSKDCRPRTQIKGLCLIYFFCPGAREDQDQGSLRQAHMRGPRRPNPTQGLGKPSKAPPRGKARIMTRSLPNERHLPSKVSPTPFPFPLVLAIPVIAYESKARGKEKRRGKKFV